MIKKLISIAILLVLAGGCGNSVKNTMSPGYNQSKPATVAIMPVIWNNPGEKEDDEIAFLFRKMTSNALLQKNYRTLALDAVDSKLKENRASGVNDSTDISADSFLYIRIKEWDKDRLSAYASLIMKASFELYSANGTRLWTAEYSTKEFDLSLDKKTIEYGVFGAYEPRVERFVEAVLSTLPQGEAPKKAEKTFFQWLP
ncbi:MAG: hypothetical protein HY954_02835 [Deltaproteobacteria bacterium]|nr:hypothetical protein [Deltaproteobacteria bacterium]